MKKNELDVNEDQKESYLILTIPWLELLKSKVRQYHMFPLKHVILATKDLKQPSPALSEIGDNCRVKIYCLMWRIGFNDQLPGVDTEDYVTLALIEKYYDFKVSEVWNEIINELEHDNIKLIGNFSTPCDLTLTAF